MQSFTTCLTLIIFVIVMSCRQKVLNDHSRICIVEPTGRLWHADFTFYDNGQISGNTR